MLAAERAEQEDIITDSEEADGPEPNAAGVSSSPTLLPEGNSAFQADSPGESWLDSLEVEDIFAPSDTTSMIISYLEALSDSGSSEGNNYAGSAASSQEAGSVEDEEQYGEEDEEEDEEQDGEKDEEEAEDEYIGPRDQTAGIKAYTSKLTHIFGDPERVEWGEPGLLPDYEIVSQAGSICLHDQEEDEPHNPKRCVLCRVFERPCETVGKKPAQQVLHATRATMRAMEISEKARLITERLKLCEVRDQVTETLGLIPDQAVQKQLLLDYLEISRLLSGAIHDTMRLRWTPRGPRS
jgi:hypothetical protein